VVSAARIGGREAIPTLEELLDAFPETRFNIDVKALAAVRPLVDAVRRTNGWDRVCVGSFSEARLARVRAAAGPRLATSAGPRDVVALKLRSLARGAVPLARGARRRAVCLQVPERLTGGGDTGPRLVDRAFVGTAHALGLQVHVWTVNEADRMRSLLDLGVDGIMTDHIDVLRDVLIERGAWF
jgi:glycerophosphoryl diester phosphodiesterase